VISYVALVGYVAVGLLLESRANRWLRASSEMRARSSLFHPEDFKSEGERARLTALRFWRLGFAVVFVLLVLLRPR
jgi:hypothetical protein